MSSKLLAAIEQVKALPTITLGNIVDHVEGEAILIISLVSILPFMQPIPLPGLSSVLGLVVLLQGVGLLFWGKPLLTRKMRQIVISHERFEVIQRAAKKFNKFTSAVSIFKHPVAGTRGSEILCGLSIVLSAAFLSLPLPIPFSNLIPALGIFLICVGLLEEDVILLLMGHGITATVGFFAMFSYQMILELVHNWV